MTYCKAILEIEVIHVLCGSLTSKACYEHEDTLEELMKILELAYDKGFEHGSNE